MKQKQEIVHDALYEALYKEAEVDLYDDIYWDLTLEEFPVNEHVIYNILPYLNKLDIYGTDGEKFLIHNRDTPGGFVEIPDGLIRTIFRCWDEPKAEYIQEGPELLRDAMRYISLEERESYEKVEQDPDNASEKDKENHEVVRAKLGKTLSPRFEYLRDYLPYEL